MKAQIVRTASGSIYLVETPLDGPSSFITRVCDPDEPPVISARLRRDGDTLRVLAWAAPPQVGRSMVYAVDVRGDGIVTWRTSTAVLSVTEAELR